MSETATISPTSQLVEAVDAAHGGEWILYRAAIGGWCVRIKPWKVVSAPTIEEVLQRAVEWRDLPPVRRKPSVYHMHRFALVRDGSKWRLMYDGSFLVGNIATKAKAMESAQGFCDRSAAALQKWEDEYGAVVSGGTEGVDFRYAD